jgi:7,8-didemethyl-8-hydroxy-5-deazariboflavin synthase CofG subunit
MNITFANAYLPTLSRQTTDEICAKACEIRDAHWGHIVTYSRKVFAPLTNMCRDSCGYCTFVKHPGSPEAQMMTPEAVLDIARHGAREGCKELLVSLGEKPEKRHAEARDALAQLGYHRLTDYLRDICARVLSETSLLPHVNAGTLSADEFAQLRPVCASMGMMLETTSRRLTRRGMAHHRCPDKVPLQRLRTLERAGLARVPFTTGLLIGIGETWDERLEALCCIEASHRRHGHIQEVIIQNFQPKPGTDMAHWPEPGLEEMMRIIAAARIILSPEISLQAPPNLSIRHIDYLRAGINDWGGISPVSIDFINPQHDWPEIRLLAAACAAQGHHLRERLTVYPRFLRQDHDEYLAPEIRTRLRAMAGTNGLARVQTDIGAPA